MTGKIELNCIEGTMISVGEGCLFSGEIHFRTGDSHSVLDLEEKRINKSQDIVIGNHVWIGYRAMLLKGALISNDSVVAAGAVVTKKFSEPNIAIGGNPAKIIKRGISWKS